ncbi:hypothetical protein KIL84_020737 [Mauremys mutica]|uniref:Uncharacterized protein n=1 Tax=Mauremys mutica TaxID=74926 RepID=A0A9D3XAW5_9SAUR|nr:hypothetical protein KIL84_020737 [Mauremys mutica]
MEEQCSWEEPAAMPAAPCIQVNFPTWAQEWGVGVRGEGSTVQELGGGVWGAHGGQGHQNTSLSTAPFSLRPALAASVTFQRLRSKHQAPLSTARGTASNPINTEVLVAMGMRGSLGRVHPAPAVPEEQSRQQQQPDPNEDSKEERGLVGGVHGTA